MSASPRLLVLDTSTEACSAAVFHDGEVSARYELLPRGHAQRILTMLNEVLGEAGLTVQQLDAVAFCRGPGAFAGVRIGCSVAQGIAFGAGLPVVPVSTLAALAETARLRHGAEHALVAIDARMGEVYFAHYAVVDGLMQLQGSETVAAPAALSPPPPADWLAIGTGWQSYRAELTARLGEPTALVEALPRAADCVPLALAALRAGAAVAPELALPVYLRDKVTG